MLEIGMSGVIIVGDLSEFAQVVVTEMKTNVLFTKLLWRKRTVSKTWRKEKVIKASDIKARDDLDGMRRGHAHVLKTKYTRKTKHKGKGVDND